MEQPADDPSDNTVSENTQAPNPAYLNDGHMPRLYPAALFVVKPVPGSSAEL
jgi:hypothetical protein